VKAVAQLPIIAVCESLDRALHDRNKKIPYLFDAIAGEILSQIQRF
jgi:hypothetical protein